MKKSLLIASMALMASSSAFAVKDGCTYEKTNGFTCENIWIADRTSNIAGWNELPFAAEYAKARTAALATINGEDKIIVGYSKNFAEGDGDAVDHAQIVILDFAKGTVEKTIQMTYNGSPITGLLCANQVGCDDFGHVWFAGYVASTYNKETGKFTPLTVYYVKDWTTGACEKAAELVLPEDETDAVGRIDYCDLNGDVTREKAPCTVMTALATAEKPYVLGWRCEQGKDEWTGSLDDYVSIAMEQTYPADQTNWGTAPMVRIVKSEDFAANLFYVDAFTTCPALYDASGAMLESFASAVELAPKPGTNGVGEFTIGGKNFIAYSVAQYDVTPGCQVCVAELGEDMAFEGMTSYWLLPANGLGEVSDGGTRIHAVETKVYPDKNGKEGVNLLTYKCNNGIGVYGIGEEGWENPVLAAVNDIVADEDVNAPVEYFNLNGVAVDGSNLNAGLYITRQGSTVKKVVVK